MKSKFTALCIAAGLLGSSLAFAATPVSGAAPAEPAVSSATSTSGVTKPAKKKVKKHATKKVIRKAPATS